MLHRNEERLLRYLYERWEAEGKPDVLPLSANQISKEWSIIKNETTKVVVPVEVPTSRSYVARLLSQLENKGFLSYESSVRTKPSIRLNPTGVEDVAA